jgi:U3 small nucleolar RNA-associated protein 24
VGGVWGVGVACSDPIPAVMWFSHNTQLGPPYHVILDTNFINFCVKNKIDVMRGLMDCLLAKVVPCITSCVMAELEKLGPKFRIALRIAKDPRFRRIPTEGDYADDNIVKLVTDHRCYCVATADKALQRRLRKVPGVPILTIARRQITVERLPEAIGAPK